MYLTHRHLLSCMLASAFIMPILQSDSYAQEQAHLSLDQAITQGTTELFLRLAYISSNPDLPSANTTYATGVGGVIKYETGRWKNFNIAVGAYFSEKIGGLSGDPADGKLNTDFFDENGDSYAYLGEAYIDYAWSNGSLRWGRQQIDSPFINTDNIRMLPHTYEALWIRYDPSELLHLEGGYTSKWAGFASGGDPGQFKQVGEDGIYALGAIYQLKPTHNLQAWYYDFTGSYQLLYTDVMYTQNDLGLGVQFADYSEENNSGIDGIAWGVMASYNLENIIVVLAYNQSVNDPGKTVSVGLCGCGAFFTSLDETNIAGKTDASAYMFALEYSISEQFVVSVAYGHFEDLNKTTTDIDEFNLILAYQLNDRFDMEFIYADVSNNAQPNDTDTNFSRQLLRVNYLL